MFGDTREFSFAVDHPDFSVGSREGVGQRAVSHNMRGVVQPAAAARGFDGAPAQPVVSGRLLVDVEHNGEKITWVFYLKAARGFGAEAPRRRLVPASQIVVNLAVSAYVARRGGVELAASWAGFVNWRNGRLRPVQKPPRWSSSSSSVTSDPHSWSGNVGTAHLRLRSRAAH